VVYYLASKGYKAERPKEPLMREGKRTSMAQSKLFIDDIKSAPEGFALARNSEEAVNFIKANGVPDFLSLDYDLGFGPNRIDFNDNGMIIVDFIIDGVHDGSLELPPGFDYDVYSSNVLAARLVRQKMDGLLKELGRRNS
jgi:hypothetical protein